MTIEELNELITEYKTDYQKEHKDIQDLSYPVRMGKDIPSAILGQLNLLLLDIEKIILKSDQIEKEISKFNPDDVSIKLNELKQNKKDLMEQFINLKQQVLDRYNREVDSVRKNIKDLKAYGKEYPDIDEAINKVSIPNRCNDTITDYRYQIKESKINLDKINEAKKSTEEIQKMVGDNRSKEEKDFLDDITHVEAELDVIEYDMALIGNIESSISKGKITNNLGNVIKQGNEIDNLVIKLTELNRKKIIDDDKYNDYLYDIGELSARGNKIKQELKNKSSVKYSKEEKNEYYASKQEITQLGMEIDGFQKNVEKYAGAYDISALDLLNSTIKSYEDKIADIKKKIEENKTNGKYDENAAKNLYFYLAGLEDKLKKIDAKSKETGFVKDASLATVTSKLIDNTSSQIDALNTRINGITDKHINKEARKDIDQIILKLENDIKFYEEQLKHMDGNDLAKVEEVKNKLSECKNKLNDVCKEYRKKCPFLVKTVKSAKDFYKKHKKEILIVAGLAALALLFQPVIIPAIMHGNLMLMNKIPLLKGALYGINNILGNAIKASIVSQSINGGPLVNVWRLASGVVINPTCASASILKGLAFSGVGSAAIIVPIVKAIKALSEKMKKHEQKENDPKKTGNKLKEKGTEIVEKVKDTVSNAKSKTDEKKRQLVLNKAVLNYINLGKTNVDFVDYCKDNGIELSEEEINKYNKIFANNVSRGEGR